MSRAPSTRFYDEAIIDRDSARASRHQTSSASHCTAFEEANGFTRSYVTFDPNFGTDPNHDIFSTPYVGEIVTNPAYKPPYHSDASLILLDEPVSGISPAQIAPSGLLDELKQAQELNDLAYTNVGYGTSEQVVVKGTGPTFPFDGIRKVTVSGLRHRRTGLVMTAMGPWRPAGSPSPPGSSRRGSPWG